MGVFWKVVSQVEAKCRQAEVDSKLEYAKGLHDAMEAFKGINQDSRWISVQDRLPPDEHRVWIWDGQKVDFDSYCVKRRNIGMVMDDLNRVQPSTGWWEHYVVDSRHPAVICWMPIEKPEAPEEGK